MQGYGAEPPDAKWPGGARIAVQFVVNYEEGAENSVLHGDAASETFLFDIVGRPGRAAALQKFLDYIGTHDKVRVARRIDIANHWRENHAP